ncbi:MAG: 4-hydroxy-tetrahydrodipicolinate reductase, partial [Rhizobium ruizarguesonis]
MLDANSRSAGNIASQGKTVISPIKIAVAGVNGRMGRAILPLLAGDPDFAFVGGIGRQGSSGAGLI